ncbi:hypothetical protein [Chitinilyticum aquatile]|uniref:hypothetical protein n=1 Tax=Chitinilyticum aquatile TaxID=362520 RepID=UPI00048F4276|nr:hypothetical protein [Chitinilyticum aquatile]
MSVITMDTGTSAQRVTRFQARCALDAWQLLDDVEALIALPETPKAVRFAWQDASHFYRQSPLIDWASQQIRLTDAQVDELFRLAATINFDN